MGKERVAHQENLGAVDSLDLLPGCSGKEAKCSTGRNGQSGSHFKLGKFELSLLRAQVRNQPPALVALCWLAYIEY